MENFRTFSHLIEDDRYDTIVAIQPRGDYPHGGLTPKTMVTIEQEKNGVSHGGVKVPLEQLKLALQKCEQEVE